MGGISKSGDAMTREMLFEAALVLMTHSRKWSWLKACGMKIARHRGMKRAIVAVARRLAVIMHRMRVDGTSFAGAENKLRRHDWQRPMADAHHVVSQLCTIAIGEN
jgi:hypothetical protein